MTTSSDLPDSLLKLVCAAMGIAAAVALSAAHWTVPVAKQRQELRVGAGVRFSTTAATVSPADVVPIPIQTTEAPTKRSPRKTPRAESAKEATAPPPVADAAPIVEPATVIELKQPGMELPQPTVSGELPPLPGAPATDGPQAPPDSYQPPQKTYSETPGGETLVLGILINETGQAVDSRILVPSHDALADVTWAMAALRQRFTNIEPPMRPGEQRWLETRAYFPKPKKDILP